jgi:hypothetical protein
VTQTPGFALAETPVASPQAPSSAEKPIGSALGGEGDLIETHNAPVDTTGLRRAVLDVGVSEGLGIGAEGAKPGANALLAEISRRLVDSPVFADRYGDLDGFILAAVTSELARFDAG